MRRIAITLLAGLLVSLGTNAPAASTTGMFPANLNDSWMVQRFGEEETQIRVTALARPGWLFFEGMFDMDLWLRASGAKVYARTRATTPQQLLYDFEAEQGREWEVELGDLVGFATVVAKDATNFGVIQMMVALLLLTLIIAVIAFWPDHWKIRPHQSEKTNR